jgi:hypothetical protein
VIGWWFSAIVTGDRSTATQQPRFGWPKKCQRSIQISARNTSIGKNNVYQFVLKEGNFGAWRQPLLRTRGAEKATKQNMVLSKLFLLRRDRRHELAWKSFKMKELLLFWCGCGRKGVLLHTTESLYRRTTSTHRIARLFEYRFQANSARGSR